MRLPCPKNIKTMLKEVEARAVEAMQEQEDEFGLEW